MRIVLPAFFAFSFLTLGKRDSRLLTSTSRSSKAVGVRDDRRGEVCVHLGLMWGGLLDRLRLHRSHPMRLLPWPETPALLLLHFSWPRDASVM